MKGQYTQTIEERWKEGKNNSDYWTFSDLLKFFQYLKNRGVIKEEIDKDMAMHIATDFIEEANREKLAIAISLENQEKNK